MEEFVKGGAGTVALVLCLLPGFAGLSVYDYLVVGIKRDVFDRIVFALSLTLVSSISARFVFHTLAFPVIVIKPDTSAFDVFQSIFGRPMLYTTIRAIFLGMLLAFTTNHGAVLSAARRVGLTFKTSTVDVWQASLTNFRATGS